MLEKLKRRLVHFSTDGAGIVTDFVEARQSRAAVLRRVVHACFYIQCVMALVCVIMGFSMGGALTGALLTVGALASCAAALMAVPGDTYIATVSYVLNIVYAVICFILGGTLFDVCGALMLVSAAAALCGFGAGYLRGWLLGISPASLTESDYTLTRAKPAEAPAPVREVPPQPEKPPAPSDLMIIAEQVSHIMSAPRDDNRKEHVQ